MLLALFQIRAECNFGRLGLAERLTNGLHVLLVLQNDVGQDFLGIESLAERNARDTLDTATKLARADCQRDQRRQQPYPKQQSQQEILDKWHRTLIQDGEA